MKNKTISIDLSTVQTSFTSYLVPHLPTIHRKTHEEIVVILTEAKSCSSVSERYLEQVLLKVEEIRHRKGAVARYIADIILKGSNLGVI